MSRMTLKRAHPSTCCNQQAIALLTSVAGWTECTCHFVQFLGTDAGQLITLKL